MMKCYVCNPGPYNIVQMNEMGLSGICNSHLFYFYNDALNNAKKHADELLPDKISEVEDVLDGGRELYWRKVYQNRVDYFLHEIKKRNLSVSSLEDAYK
jgi:hypothetical protein